jgi:UTP--glucose-1-phosphate uridylyltransferase
VVAAAGSATRMWPASKVVPKELFPLARVPAIVHLMWEFLEAGIQKAVVVVSEEAYPLMKALFDPATGAPSKAIGDRWVQRFQRMLNEMEVLVIRQSQNYGNGTPLILAADLIKNGPCIYAFGDDIVFGENPSKALISIFHLTGFPVLATQHVEPDRKSLFGIVECHTENGIEYVSRIIEKPSPTETQSCLAAFGRYLVTHDLMQTVLSLSPGRDGEIWFSDSIVQRLRQEKRVCAFSLTTGKWYTVGDAGSYAAAVKAATDEYLMSLQPTTNVITDPSACDVTVDKQK